jgi:hypothetical protein
MATFMKVKFCEKKRAAANALLGTHKMIWRCPETAGKRAKPISAGNDSRRLCSNGALLTGLFEIFYGDVCDAEQAAAIVELGAAADANDAVREDGAPAQPHLEPQQAASSARARKAPVGVTGRAGVQKKSTSTTKKKAVAGVAGPGGKKATPKEVRAYAATRGASEAAAAFQKAAAQAPEHAPADEPAPNEEEADARMRAWMTPCVPRGGRV